MESTHIEKNTDTDRFTLDDISVVMATYNEKEAIGTVIEDIYNVTENKAEIICIDSSTDQTPDIARSYGARVIKQEPQGYGIAVLEGLKTATRDVIITTDCDNTYPMDRIIDFLNLINDGYDVVSGDRLYYGAESMPKFNRIGNHLFALLASFLTGRYIHDTTTGMRAYRKSLIKEIRWTENTGLSAELILRPILRGYSVREEPIEYNERLGETKLNPIKGGLEIGYSILKVCIEERL